MSNLLKWTKMRTSELNINLRHKRVKCICTGMETTGRISHIVYYTNKGKYYDLKPRPIDMVIGEYVMSAGVEIVLDKPVVWGDQTYYEFESISRTGDEFGNLKYTELID